MTEKLQNSRTVPCYAWDQCVFSHVIFVFIEGDNIACVVTLYVWERTGVPSYPVITLTVRLLAFLCLKCQFRVLDINVTIFLCWRSSRFFSCR